MGGAGVFRKPLLETNADYSELDLDQSVRT